MHSSPALDAIEELDSDAEYDSDLEVVQPNHFEEAESENDENELDDHSSDEEKRRQINRPRKRRWSAGIFMRSHSLSVEGESSCSDDNPPEDVDNSARRFRRRVRRAEDRTSLLFEDKGDVPSDDGFTLGDLPFWSSDDEHDRLSGNLVPSQPEVIQSAVRGVDEDQDASESLQRAIMDARLETLDEEGRYFLPLDKLNELITHSSIKRELQRPRYRLRVNEDILSGIAQNVLKLKRLQFIPIKRRTSRRKIFAVLAMLQRAELIQEVIQEALYDSDLPFEFAYPEVFRRADDGEQPVQVQFLRDLEPDERHLFEKYQYQMLAPYFVLNWHPAEPVYHYQLSRRCPLPFLPGKGIGGDVADSSSNFSGSSGMVLRVQIHSAHFKYLPKQVGISSVGS
jgi:hypothetical protein